MDINNKLIKWSFTPWMPAIFESYYNPKEPKIFKMWMVFLNTHGKLNSIPLSTPQHKLLNWHASASLVLSIRIWNGVLKHHWYRTLGSKKTRLSIVNVWIRNESVIGIKWVKSRGTRQQATPAQHFWACVMEVTKPHLDVAQGTAEHTEVGGLLLVHVGDVLLQSLEALLQVRPPDRGGSEEE